MARRQIIKTKRIKSTNPDFGAPAAYATQKQHILNVMNNKLNLNVQNICNGFISFSLTNELASSYNS